MPEIKIFLHRYNAIFTPTNMQNPLAIFRIIPVTTCNYSYNSHNYNVTATTAIATLRTTAYVELLNPVAIFTIHTTKPTTTNPIYITTSNPFNIYKYI
jgi:hypothetical protein